jgi:hypothetical protein
MFSLYIVSGARMRERQSWLPMGKMKIKVPREGAWAGQFEVPDTAKQPDRRSAGALVPARPRSLEQREIIVGRVGRSPLVFSLGILGILAAAPLAPASGQNLDAGKSASQIFAEVCANCHRSPREFRSNPGASFLREHYTTGPDMAATMSAYLASAGSDPRAAGAPQPKRQPPANPATSTRDAPSAEPAREPRRTQQIADPKVLPVAPAPTRGHPASARAEGTAETKPPAPPAPPAPPPLSPPAPPRPVLEDFEE